MHASSPTKGYTEAKKRVILSEIIEISPLTILSEAFLEQKICKIRIKFVDKYLSYQQAHWRTFDGKTDAQTANVELQNQTYAYR